MTGDVMPAVVRARPERMRRVCAAVAAAIVLGSAGLALVPIRSSSGATLGTADQVGLFGLGLVVAAAVLLLGRPTVRADHHGLRVRNVVGRHDVPWTVVRAVTFRDRSPWASLELADDETLALMAVQALDGERAVAAVRALRDLHARYGAGAPAG